MVDCIGNWADNQFNEKRVGKQLSKYSCSDHPLILSPSSEKPSWKFNKARSSAIPVQPPTPDQAARISHQASRSEWGLFQLQYSCWWLRERKQWGWWIFSWGGKWNSVVTWWFQLGIKVFTYFDRLKLKMLSLIDIGVQLLPVDLFLLSFDLSAVTWPPRQLSPHNQKQWCKGGRPCKLKVNVLSRFIYSYL